MTERTDTQEAIRERVLAEHRVDGHGEMSDEELRLHATLHTVVETQLLDTTLPFISSTLRRLVAGGLSRHDAIHAIMAVVAVEVMQALQEGQGYDEARYRRALSEVTVESYRLSLAARAEGRRDLSASMPDEEAVEDEIIVKMKVEGDGLDDI